MVGISSSSSSSSLSLTTMLSILSWCCSQKPKKAHKNAYFLIFFGSKYFILPWNITLFKIGHSWKLECFEHKIETNPLLLG
jgi:hypothetical protein